MEDHLKTIKEELAGNGTTQFRGWGIVARFTYQSQFGRGARKEWELTATYQRTRLEPQLKEPSPFIGRATKMSEDPLCLEITGLDLEKCIKEILKQIYKMGKIDRVVVYDKFKTNS